MNAVLVVAAHPDDEILGCGGTIARLSKEGYKAYTLILGEGVTSRDEKRDVAKRENEIKELKRQVHKANEIIMVKEVFTYDFPDNRFDTVALLDIVKTIEKIKKEVNPCCVFTHYQGDLNVDHQITFQAVMTTCRPLKGETVKEIYSFEVPSSTEWSSENFLPSCYVHIDEKSLKLKIEAMKCYEDELKEYPHPRSPEAIDVLARSRGINSGHEFAEAFQTIRIIKGL